MANLGTRRASVGAAGSLPPLDAAGSNFRIQSENYTTIDSLIKATKDEVMPNLGETYGDQGISGFLKLTGAINSGGSSDQIDWWETGRRHKKLAYTAAGTTIDVSGADFVEITDSEVCENLQENDVVMDSETGVRFIVQNGGFATGSAANVKLVKLDGTDTTASTDIDATTAGELIVLGNMYGQGTNQPTAYRESNITRYSNPFMIVKGRHEVNGSQATNIGWVDVGGGEYRWFMYAEQEARARFEDQRE